MLAGSSRSADLTVDRAVHHGEPGISRPVPRPGPIPVLPRPRGSARRSWAWDRRLYSHQARSWELSEKGHHVVVVTPTASGKTSATTCPRCRRWCTSPTRGCSICPHEALAQDQLAELRSSPGSCRRCGCSPTTATPPGRAAGRPRPREPRPHESRHAPLGILPHHTKWSDALSRTSDTCRDRRASTRTGVSSARILANVLRRLGALPPLWLGATIHHGLRDHREPG